LRVLCGAQLKSCVPHGGRPKLAKQVMKELRRAWRSDRHSMYGGGLTANLCFGGGLIAWAHGMIVSLCSGRGLTARTCGMTASCGQR
jgi:hypothetical protein